MKTTLLVTCAIAPLALGGSIFDAPDGWIDLELPNPDPSQVAVMEGFSSPDGTTRVTATQLSRPMRTTRDAEDMVRGQLNTLARSGFQHEFTRSTNFGRYEAKHIRGEMPGPEPSIVYLFDSYAVFSASAVVSISVLVDAEHGTRESGDDLLKLVTIPGDPIALLENKGAGEPSSDAYRVGYLVGKILGYTLIAGLIFFGIRYIVRRRSTPALAASNRLNKMQ